MEALSNIYSQIGIIGFLLVFFVVLITYVLKTNDKREKRLLDTIDALSDKFSELKDLKAVILGVQDDVKEVKNTLHEIDKK